MFYRRVHIVGLALSDCYVWPVLRVRHMKRTYVRYFQSDVLCFIIVIRDHALGWEKSVRINRYKLIVKSIFNWLELRTKMDKPVVDGRENRLTVTCNVTKDIFHGAEICPRGISIVTYMSPTCHHAYYLLI